VAPADVDFDWTEGMAKENLEEFALAKEGGAAYEAHMAATGEAIRAITNDNFFDVMGDLWPPVDRVAIEDKGQVSAFVDDFVLAFQDGHGGYLDDNVAFFKPWGFSVAQVKVPVALYFGDADAMVPPSHGRWLAENIDGAQVHFSPGGGHISVVYDGQDRIGHEILEFLTV
jgi:pimeloyl-ACP methyl ester carboxylesterase